MAKAPPKNPKTAETPADQVGAQQDTTAQGTNNDQAAADAAAAAEAEARARADAEAAAAEQARADAEAQAKADAEAAAAAQARADAEAAAQAQAAAKADQAAKDATAAPQRDAEGRLEYEVVSPLTSHKRFEIGETVWLSDEEAKPLKGHTVRPAVPQDKPEAETQE